MSKYTTELRFICESITGYDKSQGLHKTDEIITAASPLIFEDYPLFTEAHRLNLNKKIISHYYFREIGFETYALWKFKLNAKMKEIMPYYNQLYQSAALEFNPFNDVDYTRTLHGETGEQYEDSGTRNDTGHSEGIAKYSDTPQGGLTGLRNDSYLTNATMTENDDTNAQTHSTEGTKDGTRDDLEHVNGKMGTTPYSEMLQTYRDTFLNIDMMIIEELEPLFMQLW